MPSDVDVLVEGAAVEEVASLIEQASGRMVHAIPFSEAAEGLRDRVLAHGRPL